MLISNYWQKKCKKLREFQSERIKAIVPIQVFLFNITPIYIILVSFVSHIVASNVVPWIRFLGI